MEDCPEMFEAEADSIGDFAQAPDGCSARWLSSGGGVRGGVSRPRPGHGRADRTDCGSDDVTAEILSSQLAIEPECGEISDISQSIQRSDDDFQAEVGFCLASLGPSEEEDGVLDFGSCIELSVPGPETFDVLELPAMTPLSPIRSWITCRWAARAFQPTSSSRRRPRKRS